MQAAQQIDPERYRQLEDEVELWHAHIKRAQPHYAYCPFCGKGLQD